MKKLIVVILVLMNISLWTWYAERDRRDMMDRVVNEATFKAQNEVLTTHAKAINDQTRLLKRIFQQD